jgi:hypothetical protein
VLCAALLLTVLLLSQRGVQVAAPGAVGERHDLAAAAAAAAAAGGGMSQPTLHRAGSALGSSHPGIADRQQQTAAADSSSRGTAGSSRTAGSTSSTTAVGAAAGHDAPPATAAAAACDLEVEPSQWADSCVLLHDACVDQGSIILYGQEHAMDGSSPGMAPHEIMPTADYRKYIFLHRGSHARDYRYGHAPIRVRPASSQEGAAYLAQPAFSSCTVPIIWWV